MELEKKLEYIRAEIGEESTTYRIKVWAWEHRRLWRKHRKIDDGSKEYLASWKNYLVERINKTYEGMRKTKE